MHSNAKHRCSDAQKRSHSHIDWVISISLSCCLVWASLWALEWLHIWFLCFSCSPVVTMKESCFSIRRRLCRFYNHAILFSPGLSCMSVTSDCFHLWLLLSSTSPSSLSLSILTLSPLTMRFNLPLSKYVLRAGAFVENLHIYSWLLQRRCFTCRN